MGAELADLVPLEDVILTYPVQLAGRIVPYSFHLRKSNKIDAARCVSIVYATLSCVISSLSQRLMRYITFFGLIMFSLDGESFKKKRRVHDDVSNEFFIILRVVTRSRRSEIESEYDNKRN